MTEFDLTGIPKDLLTSKIESDRRLKVQDLNHYIAVKLGKVPGQTIIGIQGLNPSVSIGTPENLWDLGGLYEYPIINEAWSIESDDSNDTLLGTGAQRVVLKYLDSNYILLEEEIEMNGTTPVPFLLPDKFRVADLVTIEVGSTGSNAGTIRVFKTSDGANRIGMLPQNNLSLHAMITIPDGKVAFLIFASTSIGKNADSDLQVFSTSGSDGIFIGQLPMKLYQNAVVYPFTAPLGPILPRSDVNIRVTTSSNNVLVTAFMQFLLIDL